MTSAATSRTTIAVCWIARSSTGSVVSSTHPIQSARPLGDDFDRSVLWTSQEPAPNDAQDGELG